MSSTNKEVERVLKAHGFLDPKRIVKVLIHEGHVEADPVSPAQELADIAKAWLGNTGSSTCGALDAFDKASGWSTESWRIVANGSYDVQTEYPFNDPTKIKLIFKALVILAKEAGMEL
jgi:hypothetical protein